VKWSAAAASADRSVSGRITSAAKPAAWTPHGELRGEAVDLLLVPGDECDLVALGSEAVGDCQAKAGPAPTMAMTGMDELPVRSSESVDSVRPVQAGSQVTAGRRSFVLGRSTGEG
jgi:hypothetical protein